MSEEWKDGSAEPENETAGQAEMAAEAEEIAREAEGTEEGTPSETDSEAEGKKKKAKDSKSDDLLFFAKALLIGAVIALFVRFVTPLIFVDGNSMNQTLYNKELCIGCTLLTPKQGNIVIFKNKATNGKIYIKRVIAEPGSSVNIEHGVVSVDGEELDESKYIYISDPNGSYLTAGYPKYTTDVTLSDTQYYVCGDNRCNSNDSRYIGPVEKSDIIAVVVVQFDMRWLTNLFSK